MSNHTQERPPIGPVQAVIIAATIVIAALLLIDTFGQLILGSAQPEQTPLDSTVVGSQQTPYNPTLPPAETKELSLTQTLLVPVFTHTPSPTITSAPSKTSTPANTPTPTLTPTPTRDLARCNAAGCGINARPLPTVEYDSKLLLRSNPPKRRDCPECPKNDRLSDNEIDALLEVNPAALAKLETIALSQQPYQIAPGIVYIVSDYVHHVVVDLKESGFKLRNIIPPIPDPETRENIRITPSYCLGPDSLVVMTADYHGLVGSNKTDDGRAIFFHLGRAALFQLDGEYDLNVIREDADYDRATISWGGGPIFMWDGEYNYNPEQEWFTPENLDHYKNTKWAKMVAAISDDRRYLFLSASFGLSLEEHADNVIDLGKSWGINVDRAMRFDGSESAYLAIRLDDYLVPILSLEEPLIVNCFAIEKE